MQEEIGLHERIQNVCSLLSAIFYSVDDEENFALVTFETNCKRKSVEFKIGNKGEILDISRCENVEVNLCSKTQHKPGSLKDNSISELETMYVLLDKSLIRYGNDLNFLPPSSTSLRKNTEEKMCRLMESIVNIENEITRRTGEK